MSKKKTPVAFLWHTREKLIEGLFKVGGGFMSAHQKWLDSLRKDRHKKGFKRYPKDVENN
jgi:hypothetical protein